MVLPLSDLEKIERRSLLFVKICSLGILSSLILTIILSALYQGLIQTYYSWPSTPIRQELNTIEIFWMITFLLQLFFLNATIWYFISYKLCIKSIKTLSISEKSAINNVICYNCGIVGSTEITKANKSKELRSTHIFNIEGCFCKECYRKYSRITIGTIALFPVIYFLVLILTLLLLGGFGLTFIPQSYWYLYSMTFPIFILTIIVIILYVFYVFTKASNIYGLRKEKLVM